ncbi:hypothetical protein CC86DRAFT_375957 [Ophiobolus disseminans]|uniref:Uncharacterized protein n=1 Tax=Ophiobolus disseminans TaxID=1469910 RepID=A0A6A6ZC07_9PLEO|nr:hypothetical protein CC86DRAFT_375957 [Ophiobolus disseminans]
MIASPSAIAPYSYSAGTFSSIPNSFQNTEGSMCTCSTCTADTWDQRFAEALRQATSAYSTAAPLFSYTDNRTFPGRPAFDSGMLEHLPGRPAIDTGMLERLAGHSTLNPDMLEYSLVDNPTPNTGMLEHSLPDNPTLNPGMLEHVLPDNSIPDTGMLEHSLLDDPTPDTDMPEHSLPDDPTPNTSDQSIEPEPLADDPLSGMDNYETLHFLGFPSKCAFVQQANLADNLYI